MDQLTSFSNINVSNIEELMCEGFGKSVLLFGVHFTIFNALKSHNLLPKLNTLSEFGNNLNTNALRRNVLITYENNILALNYNDTVNIVNYNQLNDNKCVKLYELLVSISIAELLCTQINKFNYTFNLPFDYLLPIICQWKSVYIPHQTNNKTLKYIYALNAFKFIKQPFYIPINIIIPPQKIAIVCMELSLRLNYNKYQTQQEQINSNSSMEMEYKYIDPPLQLFRIFDINANQQHLKHEINLIALEIINAIQNVATGKVCLTFFITKFILRLIIFLEKRILSHWLRGSLNIDKVHQDLMDRQTKHISKTNDNNYNYSNDRDRYNINNEHLFSGTEVIQYPYNCSNDISLGELLNVNNNNKTAIIMKHRYKIQKHEENINGIELLEYKMGKKSMYMSIILIIRLSTDTPTSTLTTQSPSNKPISNFLTQESTQNPT
ncbi:MAG: hypothetical protein GY755_02050, partial [Chloroflexi bacterium]|nr:hypothetical protein [Chloroflexota bacterium]